MKRAQYIGILVDEIAKRRIYLSYGMQGWWVPTSRNGGWFTPYDARRSKVWLSKKTIKPLREQARHWWEKSRLRSGGIVVEIVESEPSFQRVISQEHFRSLKAALAFVDHFNKDTDFKAPRYTVARVEPFQMQRIDPDYMPQNLR